MAEKLNKSTLSDMRPVPMKLFATWEIEKSAPYCIPRLCSLTLSKLDILKPLEAETHSVILAVKMQNSKRVLRSNEIIVTSGVALDIELELSFSLQYPHLLKREGNKLQIMLQRRKKYKNRTILGYKTLAMGQINMSQVLQRCMDTELDLYSDVKEQGEAVARVVMLSLMSQPVDHDESGGKKRTVAEGDMSEEEDGNEEYSSNEELSDSDPNALDEESCSRPPRFGKEPFRSNTSRHQGNIKQKFIALLRRFKVTEDVLDCEQDADESIEQNPHDIEYLFDELDNLSESDPDADTISVISTPKPKLRPFFSDRGNQNAVYNSPSKSGLFKAPLTDTGNDVCKSTDESSKGQEGDMSLEMTDGESSLSEVFMHSWPAANEFSSKTTPKSHLAKAASQRTAHERKCLPSKACVKQKSTEANEESRSAFIEDLNKLIPTDQLPEKMLLVNSIEWHSQWMLGDLQAAGMCVIQATSATDVRSCIAFISDKLHKLCKTNARAPAPVRLAVAGSDCFINSLVAPYVEIFSDTSYEYLNYLRFFIIPLGVSAIGKHLCQSDLRFNTLFNDTIWKDMFENQEQYQACRMENREIMSRIEEYLDHADNVVQMPISEIMLIYHKDHRSQEEESSQIFIPFLNEVRVGGSDAWSGSSSVEADDGALVSNLSSSPQQPILTTGFLSASVDKVREGGVSVTPPSSPSLPFTSTLPPTALGGSAVQTPSTECQELQIDFWMSPKQESFDRTDRLTKKDTRSSFKCSSKSLLVHRFAHTGHSRDTSPLSMVVITKEKKPKMMKFVKKSKEVECRSQSVEGILRLICTSKNQQQPIAVTIDGSEWTGVKFFQISSQWHSHVKTFPVMLFKDHYSTAHDKSIN